MVKIISQHGIGPHSCEVPCFPLKIMQ